MALVVVTQPSKGCKYLKELVQSGFATFQECHRVLASLKLGKEMSAKEQDSITNTLRVCRDIQNRFYSERIKVGDVDPEEP